MSCPERETETRCWRARLMMRDLGVLSAFCLHVSAADALLCIAPDYTSDSKNMISSGYRIHRQRKYLSACLLLQGWLRMMIEGAKRSDNVNRMQMKSDARAHCCHLSFVIRIWFPLSLSLQLMMMWFVTLCVRWFVWSQWQGSLYGLISFICQPLLEAERKRSMIENGMQNSNEWQWVGTVIADFLLWVLLFMEESYGNVSHIANGEREEERQKVRTRQHHKSSIESDSGNTFRYIICDIHMKRGERRRRNQRKREQKDEDSTKKAKITRKQEKEETEGIE